MNEVCPFTQFSSPTRSEIVPAISLGTRFSLTGRCNQANVAALHKRGNDMPHDPKEVPR